MISKKAGVEGAAGTEAQRHTGTEGQDKNPMSKMDGSMAPEGGGAA